MRKSDVDSIEPHLLIMSQEYRGSGIFSDEDDGLNLDSATCTPDSDECSTDENSQILSGSLARDYLSQKHGKPPAVKRSGRHRLHQEDSFGESLSTIPTAESSAEVKKVYRELQDINADLKKEFRLLQERQAIVKEKEQLLVKRELAISEDKLQFEQLVLSEVARRVSAKEQEHKIQNEKLEMIIKEKNKELKRLKENFDTVKSTNDTLRKELEVLQNNQEKLERQTSSLQARLSHMQRRQVATSDNAAPNQDMVASLKSQAEKKATAKDSKSKTKTTVCMGTYEVLGILLEWVSEFHLRPMLTDQPTRLLDGLSGSSVVQDKCLKVLPSIVELVRELPAHKPGLVMPSLQFIYWSLMKLDTLQAQQKISLSSSLRRVGEELYKARTVKFSDESQPPSEEGAGKSKEAMFFKSSNLHMRFLSSLIILRTLTQVDLVAHVLEVIKSDLKHDKTRELFLYYQATHVIVSFLKPSNKTLVNLAVDILLQMSMESNLLQQFLITCSCDTWFRSVSMLFRSPNADEKQVEKLSIILQKLSKIRMNKKFFDAFGLLIAVQEMLRTSKNDNAFLTLNLKSILFNLNTKLTLTSLQQPDASTLSGGSLQDTECNFSSVRKHQVRY